MSEFKAIYDDLKFGPDGIVPVVIQDAQTDAVLMVAFMNRAALDLTRATKRTHFWSRSRNKLWKKGETSGHEQIVEEIFVNCELNSLLITVHQIGAACHTGFPTCYYRRLEEDDSFAVVRERWFDPSTVYDQVDGESFISRTQRWYGAYEYLREHDLSAVSSTSKRLRDSTVRLYPRVADELRELAGVLTGEHRHKDLEADVLLEGSQCLYWLAATAVQAGITWNELRPDRALVTSEDQIGADISARMLISEAESWLSSPPAASEIAPRCHAAMSLVAQACRSAHVSPVSLIRKDLDDLASRDYLAPYFS